MRPFRNAWLLQLALLTGVSGCSCEQSFNKVLPTLDLNDQSIDFGEVAVNSTSLPRTLTLKAVTAAAIKVSFELQDDTDDVFKLEAPIPATVPPNGKATLSLTFKPKAVKAYAATLVVTSDDPNPARSVHRISISGVGESPQIEVTPDHLSFSAVACPAGAMSTRCRDEQTVTLHNVGLVNLTLGVVKVVGSDASTSAPANLTLKTLVSTSTILPGDTLAVTVLWRPRGDLNPSNAQTGDFEARLEIPSDDPAHPVTYVALAAHSDPAAAPHVCLNGLAVTQRKYSNNNTGHPTVSNQPVSTGAWVDPTNAQRLQGVLPGMTVTMTTLPFTETCAMIGTPPAEVCTRAVDPAKVQQDPCTFDPQDLPLTTTWSLIQAPTTSRTGASPIDDSGIASANAVLPIDAAGTYQVTVRVVDTLGLSATATMTLEAPLHDDLLTQLSWPALDPHPGVDMDLHLIVDSGPGISVPGTFLSTQDCYWQNPVGNWFNDPAADLRPVFLLDDQGTSALLESINLLTAPVGSRFRAVVHQFAGDDEVKASLQMFHTGVAVPVPGGGTVVESSQTLGLNKIWIGAQIEFTNCPVGCTTGMCCTPTITKLDQYCKFEQDPGGGFSGVATDCTGGASL